MNIINRNHIKIKGEGDQVILFAHGFGCDQQMWYAIEEYFLPQYKLVYFDHVGSGQSDQVYYDKEKYSTLEGYAADLIEIIETLELESIIFIGHSISSMIGMLAALDMPHAFQKLVMIGPSPCYINEDHYKGGFDKQDIEDLLAMMEMNFTGWASYLAPIVMDDANPVHPKQLEATFVSGNPQVARQFAEVTFYSDYRQQLSQLTVPTLLIQCSDDSIVPIQVGDYLHAKIPNSELVIMDAKGHYPHISRPKETADIMLVYIEKMGRQFV